MENLQGKVAVITGGASGIGRAMAERFLGEGMQVVIGDIEESVLRTTADELSGLGEVEAVVTDVTDLASVENLAQATTERFGAYHVVCNNAGVAGHFGLSWETSLEDWRWVFDVNVFGLVNGIRAFVPGLIAQGEGHVVVTSSGAAFMAMPSAAKYIGSKHASFGIAHALREELAAINAPIGVTVLCPGATDTPFVRSERNWPSSRGAEPLHGADPVSSAIRDLVADPTIFAGPASTPAAQAEAVLEGILNDRFIVSGHIDDVIGFAEARLELARAGKPGQ